MNDVAESSALGLGEPLLVGWPGVVAAAMLLIVPIAFVIWQYRRQRGQLTPAVAAFLTLSRTLAIVAVWMFAVFDPTLVHRRVADVPGRTIVAVDLSSSMDVADPQRSNSEKARLAIALGLAEESMLSAIENGDSSATEIVRQLDRMTRRQIATRLLSGDWLTSTPGATVTGFHDRLVENVSRDSMPNPPEGAIWSTDVRVALEPGLSNERSSRVLGVVVLSDGRQTSGTSPLDVARELRRAKVPIFAVAIGSRTPPVDVAIAGVSAPTTVFKDSETTVEAKVRVRGLPAGDISVELFDAGPPRRRLDGKTIVHNGRDVVHTVQFSTRFDAVGLKRLEVVATPRAGTAEVSIDNNTSAALIRVGEDKIRVLLASDEIGWEMHYLAMALTRDSDLRVDRIVFDPPRLRPLSDEERDRAGLPRDHWPTIEADGDDPLSEYDVIVLGEMAATRVPESIQKRLEQFVADREGTVILLGGRGKEFDPLTTLSPVDSRRSLPAKAGDRVAPTELGWRQPYIALDEIEAESRKRWSEFVPLHGSVGMLRPGATAILTAKSAKPEEAVMAEWNVGLGRVIWMGATDTWRWRYRVGDRDHQRFWGQLIRWAGSESADSDARGLVTFGAKKPVYAHGESVDVFLNLGGKSREAKDARYRIVRLDDAAKPSVVVAGSLRRRDDRPRLLEAAIAKLPPGSYRVEVEAPDLPVPVALAQRDRFTIAFPESGELADFATDVEALRSLATESGGRLLWPEEMDQLPNWLQRQSVSSDEITEQRLGRDPPWTWWVLAMIVGLMTIDWIVRKRSGLP